MAENRDKLTMEPTEEELWSLTSKKRKLGYEPEELQEIMRVDEGELKRLTVHVSSLQFSDALSR